MLVGKMKRGAAMRVSLSLIVLLTAALCAAGVATSGSAEEIEGWGTIINPDGDCTIRSSSGKVTFEIPAGVHNIWFGRPDETKRFNAPRVMREIEGDFIAQVQGTADWNPDVPTSEYYYNGAGLLVWDSEKQYLRMERNTFQRQTPPTGIHYITIPMYDRN